MRMILIFPYLYLKVFNELMTSPDVTFSCRGMQMWKEHEGHTALIEVKHSSVSVFSHTQHRVTPIRFVLAELCYILSGRSDVASIASYNKAMAHYADDDGVTMSGSYGLRLRQQLLPLVEKLKKDIFTRQACASIYNEDDGSSLTRTHIPCNVFLQFVCRPPNINLHVISRSSDFATGFSIDSLHWQALLIMVANELNTVLAKPVIPKLIFYTLGSLHVYATDKETIAQWTTEPHGQPYTYVEPYGYDLRLRLGLVEAIQRAKDMFKENLSIEELGEILLLDETSMANVRILHEKFLTHRNKLVR